MDLSIIIVNWNVSNLLRQCLKSIFLFTRDIDFEVIVVDNNSYDGSMQMLNAMTFEYSNLQVIFNKENAGFAKANNQGLAIARGKYVLFMNPDMELVENAPKILMNYIEEAGDVSACTCQLQYGDGHRQPNIKRDPGFWSQVWILYKLHHFLKPWFLKKYLAKDFDYTKEQEVEQIMGAFIFIRRDIMKKIGGWSEDYFIWWEDLDLCKRLRKMGEKIMYVPYARVIHYESRSFNQQMSLAKQKRFNRGLLTYFKKYHNWFSWFLLKLATLDSLILAWLTQLFKVEPKTQSKL
ncbi:MAG: glycosyltransferase family 2 protein [Patescibacteria group bacterium]|jgi:hypothetical protein